MKYLVIFFAGLLSGMAGLLYLQTPDNPTLQARAATAPVATTPVHNTLQAPPAQPAEDPQYGRSEPTMVPAVQASETVEADATPAPLPQIPQPEIQAAYPVPVPVPAEPDDAGLDTAATMEPTSVAPLYGHPGDLLVPVAGISADRLVDSFDDKRGSDRVHEAIDLMAPLKTEVFAVADGQAVKLFTSVPGGLTLYQYDASGTFAYYYAHLDGYAPDLVEGQALKRGDLIGYVGVTGNSDPAAPHLHFAVFVLGPEKQWWKGTAINPYPLFAR